MKLKPIKRKGDSTKLIKFKMYFGYVIMVGILAGIGFLIKKWFFS